VSYTTKKRLLTSIGLLSESEECDEEWVSCRYQSVSRYVLEICPNASSSIPLQNVAKLKFAASAVLGGTDYASNVRGKSFGTARKVALSIRGVVKADEILTVVFPSVQKFGMHHSSLTVLFLFFFFFFAMLIR